MTNAKTTKRAFLTSVVSLLICFSMLLGTTFAWFTDSAVSEGNVIKSGTLKVNLLMWNDETKKYESIENGNAIFEAGEKAQNGTETLWEPGKTQVVYLAIENAGSLDLKYSVALDVTNTKANEANGKKLTDVLQYEITSGFNAENDDKLSAWNGTNAKSVVAGPQTIDVGGTTLTAGDTNYFALSVHMLGTASDDYQDLTVTFDLKVLATQLASEKDSFGKDYDADADTDTWDGTADTSWYDPANPLSEYVIYTAEQLAGLAELVSGDTTFKGVTFTLTNDFDLYCEDTSENADGDPVTFRPIGDYSKDGTFEGTFDGNGHTISNLYQNGWDLGYDWYNYGSIGLFGEVKDATIKNVTISGAESLVEGGDVGGITGSASGTCVFENITIEDSTFATYNNGNGGIIGWSGAGNYTFKNITIAEDVTLAGLWGSFDSSIGGVVGQGEPGATYNFENVDIACRLDVYNDCTASYDYYNYRMCGMIIGRLEKTTTIDGVNYPDMSQYNITCNDVTVTYGEWADYHYCEPTPGYNNGRGMRVEPGYSYNGLPADYDHSQCTTNHNTLIPFDQIFGGDQLGVKGLKTYDGVTVIYSKHVSNADELISAIEDGGKVVVLATDIVYNNTDPDKQLLLESDEDINFDGNGNTITVTGSNPSVGNHGYVAFIPTEGEKKATVSNLTVTGTGFVELGDYNAKGGTYVANNLVIENLVTTLANENGSDTVGCAFMQYGTGTLNNCVMTGTTALIDGTKAYDAGFGNTTTTTINGGEYGVIRVWEQAHVTINGAEIDTIDSRAITYKNYGMLTIGEGTHVGTINLISVGTYTPALTIEEGATVDAIVYNGVTYTQTEWLAK